jgi:hypothetical protein
MNEAHSEDGRVGGSLRDSESRDFGGGDPEFKTLKGET